MDIVDDKNPISLLVPELPGKINEFYVPDSAQIAEECGDTFLYDCEQLSADQQWGRIVDLLNDNGFLVVKVEM